MRAFRTEKVIVAAMLCGLAMAGVARVGDPGRPSSAPKLAPVTFFMPDDATGSIDAAPAGWIAQLPPAREVLSDAGLGLFGLGAVLLVLLGWHNRQLRRSRDRAEALARDLGEASDRLERANAEISAANEALERRNEALGRRDRELGVQNRRFDAALNNMSQGLCMIDMHERLVVFNRRFAEVFAVEVAPVPGILLDDLVALTGHPQLGEILARQRAMAAAGAMGGFAHQSSDGRSLQVSHRPMPEGGWIATYDDVTQRRETEARISFLAQHDPLTGLLNRSAFERRTAVALEEMGPGGAVAVHHLDIDGLRDVNDAFGHPVGDALLREAGRRLGAFLRDGDALARISGDEFALLRRAEDRAEEGEVAGRLVALMGEPFEIGDHTIVVGAGVGTAVAPRDGDTADALLIHAHLALGQAKLAGRNARRLFEPDMDAARRARLALERDLQGALGRGEIVLHFQPLVDARKLALSGYETLARWRHPTRGMVSPTVFIPIAEETGLIADIGAHVLREACRQAAAWPPHLTVAVNLSPAQFEASDLLGTIDDALARSGLEPARLEIEITESLPLGDGDGSLDLLHAIRSRGVRIAMDDFGTGYASLSYLRRFPFDKIKIDQSFVRELSNRPDCTKIVRAMTALAASLGMTTTAEGVETPEQFAQLQAAGCDQVQGFHFGPPRPAEALTFSIERAAIERVTAAA